MMKKENYAAPATEVLEFRLEGMIATSTDPMNSMHMGGTDPNENEGVNWGGGY